MAEHTLILGGARSGKSREAERRALRHPGPVTYIATATAEDAEMAERIRKHRSRRPSHWQTVENPEDLAATLAEEAAGNGLVLVDCLTLWLANRLHRDTDDQLAAQTQTLTEVLGHLPGPCTLVANEVGLGIVPESPLARRFRDWAGHLNQQIADQCGEVVLMAAGLPLPLKGADKDAG
jgi:adenosyl cobinamide kinase/adenosyl cobinamide phosphate guanylyltransferase